MNHLRLIHPKILPLQPSKYYFHTPLKSFWSILIFLVLRRCFEGIPWVFAGMKMFQALLMRLEVWYHVDECGFSYWRSNVVSHLQLTPLYPLLWISQAVYQQVWNYRVYILQGLRQLLTQLSDLFKCEPRKSSQFYRSLFFCLWTFINCGAA